MAQKPVNIKISKEKLLDALKKALSSRKQQIADGKKAKENFDKAEVAWEKAIREHIKTGKASVKMVKHENGWRDEEPHILVQLAVPASLPFPKMEDKHASYLTEAEIVELENAIALLELSDEQMLSTSTYNGVARYIN